MLDSKDHMVLEIEAKLATIRQTPYSLYYFFGPVQNIYWDTSMWRYPFISRCPAVFKTRKKTSLPLYYSRKNKVYWEVSFVRSSHYLVNLRWSTIRKKCSSFHYFFLYLLWSRSRKHWLCRSLDEWMVGEGVCEVVGYFAC